MVGMRLEDLDAYVLPRPTADVHGRIEVDSEAVVEEQP